LSGIIVGAVVLAAAGGIIASSGYNPLQKYAKVVAVEPAYNTTRTPREVCGDQAALAQSAAAGADVAAATPAPAHEPAAPSPAAKDAKPGEEGTEDCVMVYDTRTVQAGFDVTYELDGRQKVIRMDHDPGLRIPVEDGELVLSQT
jgi:uncharacterized protein YcfJ